MEINVYIWRARSPRMDRGAEAYKFISRQNRASVINTLLNLLVRSVSRGSLISFFFLKTCKIEPNQYFSNTELALA